MNFSTIRLFTLIAFFSIQSITSLLAQDWGDFEFLLSQMDSAQRAEYLESLGTLQNITNQGTYNFNSALDSLNASLDGQNPAMPSLGAMLPPDSIVGNYLTTFLNSSNFGTQDSLSLLGEFDLINAFQATHLDSLYNLFGTYQNQFNSPPQLPNTYPGSSDWLANVGTLISNQDSAFVSIPALGLGGFDAALDQLFDPTVFTRIEIFAGVQNARTSYYGLDEAITAPVFGIRSVEQFNKSWEPRWRVQSSWLNNKSDVINNETITQQVKGFSPFIINGSFDVMYNPTIVPGSNGVPVRLLTMLGMEAGTYAPAHRNPADPTSFNNKGFTTGWGPVLGTGVSSRVGNLTIYALGTVSYGKVVYGSEPHATNYRFRSNRLEAGVQYANAVTVRYENTISANWANDGNKHVRFHQVTVGLPTTGLFRQ
ncbi:MAG: hypothetical protein H7246_08110 [Phycisphaerae bacterium]|nr:hypothetical protein [Saprospiraceae bacterium]